MSASLETVTRISADRLLRRIKQYAEIGRDRRGGVTRPGFGEADREARARLAAEVREEGLSATVDAAGNLLIHRDARSLARERPVLLLGSHFDTVVNGGALDGAYGVLAAVEVLQTLAESGIGTAHEVVVVAFANEEGALFPQPFWGSMVVAGRLAALPSEPRDHAGNPLREHLARAGGDLSDLASAVWPAGSLAGYLEVHVEQGPVLEQTGHRIGVVDVISGRTVLTVEFTGTAAHAGTTPFEYRRDPVPAAARAITAAEHLSREERRCRVATVGRVEVHPNSPNTVADSVRLTVDLRDGEQDRLRQAEHALLETFETIAAESGVQVTLRSATRSEPVRTDSALRAAITRGADGLNLSTTTLPSGAGHDAQIIADVAPVGLFFVPSIGGTSHVPTEDTLPGDLVAGAEVLLRTVLDLESTD